MTTYRLPIAIEHALPKWPLVDFRKKSLLDLTLSVRSHSFLRTVDKSMRYLGKRVRGSIVVKILLVSLKRVPDSLGADTKPLKI
jgi:hypothetical protein